MLLPKKIKKQLERNRLYIKFRYSKWIYGIWLFLRPDVRKEIVAKTKFYNSVIPEKCKLIFDIGANEGILTKIFSKRSSHVIAIEPSTRNILILSEKFSGKNITIVPLAVSDAIGEQAWYEDDNDYAMGTLSYEWNKSKQHFANPTATYVSTTTLDNLIKQYGKPDFIKIDVEGNEWKALQGLLQPVSLLSFEAILPQFAHETILCVQHLLSMSPSATFNYVKKNKFAYSAYQSADVLLNDMKSVCETVDIFCSM